MKNLVLILGFSLVAGILPVSSQEPADNKEVMIYTIAEGDSLQSLASQYLGGPQYILELLKFNKIDDPTLIGAGSNIAIPLAIRQRALDQLKLAEAELTSAVDAMAEKYAKAHYDRALQVLESARKSRQSARYDQTIAFAKLATAQSRLASQQARDKARIKQSMEITGAHGVVQFSIDQGATWKKAIIGSIVPVGGRIRTVGASRAEVTAADKSIIRLQEASEFEIKDYTLDRRNGVRNSKLKVLIGNILGEITPKENKDSKYEIDTGSATIAIRGTELRVGATADKTTAVGVLHGLTEVNAAGQMVQVPGNFGTVSRNGKAPEKPYPLLPAPKVTKPAAILHTAKQEIDFAWNSVEGDLFQAYLLEIARDPEFNQLVQQFKDDRTSLTSGVLPEGKFFWRLTSIDTNNIGGNPTETGIITIKKNMNFKVFNRNVTRQVGNKKTVSAGNAFFATAVNADHSIKELQYRLDAGEFTSLTKDLSVEKEGKHVLEVVGLAADGERTEPQKIEFHVDGQGPELNYEVKTFKDAETGIKAALVTAQVEDASRVEKLEYDSGAGWLTYEKPVKINLAAGRKIKWRATDAVGNVTEEYLELAGQAVRSSK